MAKQEQRCKSGVMATAALAAAVEVAADVLASYKMVSLAALGLLRPMMIIRLIIVIRLRNVMNSEVREPGLVRCCHGDTPPECW